MTGLLQFHLRTVPHACVWQALCMLAHEGGDRQACLVPATVLQLCAARAQLPTEEVMAYQKGQHLRNQDALLSERVRAEMVGTPPPPPPPPAVLVKF